MRLAIIGLYNSGSTILAGMLYRLGANMGAPFWSNSDDQSKDNFYEPYDLSWHLRRWWNEPNITERTTAAKRTDFLRRWIELQECVGSATVGAKHPILSLCIHDLVAGWGASTRFTWSYRDFSKSVDGLKRRGWFPGYEVAIQQRLWNTISESEQSNCVLVRVNPDDVRSDSAEAARYLASLVCLESSKSQLRNAAMFVRK